MSDFLGLIFVTDKNDVDYVAYGADRRKLQYHNI